MMHEDMRLVKRSTTGKAPAFVDWRDKAGAWLEWILSGFAGLCFGFFVSRFWEMSTWASILIGAAMTYALHWGIRWLGKRFA